MHGFVLLRNEFAILRNWQFCASCKSLSIGTAKNKVVARSLGREIMVSPLGCQLPVFSAPPFSWKKVSAIFSTNKIEELEPIATCSSAFSYASSFNLTVFIRKSHWFHMTITPVLIDHSVYCRFGSTILDREAVTLPQMLVLILIRVRQQK